MLNQLKSFFNRRKVRSTNIQNPKEICPNCWGYQEYNNKIRETPQDGEVDVINNRAKRSFIQKFVIKHLDGITLKEKEVHAKIIGRP